MNKRKFKCYACNHTWEIPYGTGRPKKCPKCGSENFHRANSGPQFRGLRLHGRKYKR